MIVYSQKIQLREYLEEARNKHISIGFVPTMGALHEGHFSLIESAKKGNDLVVVSIFVNPTQFNDPGDYNKYPRNIPDDINKLEHYLNENDVVFTPSEKEMYPEEDKRNFNFGYLEEIMEGKYRPGHFNGVAKIVSKLFEVVKPHRVYFGEKDYQQLVIIKNLVEQLKMSVKIISCPIIREPSGLALSSRNRLLSAHQKENAIEISRVLFEAKQLAGEYSVQGLKKWVVDIINSNSFLNTDYFEIVDDSTLKTIKNWDEDNKKIGCIAVFLDNIRLIDNIRF